MHQHIEYHPYCMLCLYIYTTSPQIAYSRSIDKIRTRIGASDFNTGTTLCIQ